MKKTFAILMAIVMLLSMTAMAASNVANAATGTITIPNASKGMDYTVIKLFDASATGAEDGSIVYTGAIPEALKDYFTADQNGYITKAAGKTDKDITDAVEAWATANKASGTTVTAEGGELVFTGLAYGYYAVVSEQGALVSVDSTNPNATIYDKNSTTPLAGGVSKTAADNGDDDATDTKASFNVGDTVTYTVSFKTANYSGDGADAKKIVKYTVTDTLPSFLSDVTVTEVKVGTEVLTGTFEFGAEKAFDIAWVDDAGNSLYDNGAVVTITYTAVVTDEIVAGTPNTNTVTVAWTDEADNSDEDDDDEDIYAYELTVNKVDDKGAALAGAEFELYTSETGTDKVLLVKDGDVYRPATEEEKTANDFTSAIIVAGTAKITGLASDTYYLEETKAPAGYNMLTERQKVELGGNLAIDVINNTGTELPSTGGMGTTLFYVVGSLMMAAAVVVLVAKKKVAAK